MNPQIKMVVFDLAGTTIDEQNVVYKTIQTSLGNAGYTYDLETVLLHCAGKEKREAIRDILSTLSGETPSETTVESIYTVFEADLKVAYEQLDIHPFANTTDVFRFLKKNGITVVLNTGYNAQTALNLLKKLEWNQGTEYDYLVTADDVVKGRPSPEMIRLAMTKAGISNPESVVKVGDSKVDIMEGKAAGCRYSIGVTTGAQTKEELMQASPDFVIDSLKELEQLIV